MDAFFSRDGNGTDPARFLAGQCKNVRYVFIHFCHPPASATAFFVSVPCRFRLMEKRQLVYNLLILWDSKFNLLICPLKLLNFHSFNIDIKLYRLVIFSMLTIGILGTVKDTRPVKLNSTRSGQKHKVTKID